MGLLDGLMGNASEVDAAAVQKEYGQILASEERVEKAYQLIRDMFIFTDKRLILIDKQGVTGKKAEYHSIPYKSISHFSVETAGTFDLDAELKIWISSNPVPVTYEFKRGTNIVEVQKALAHFIFHN
jgi:hypothetical protein